MTASVDLDRQVREAMQEYYGALYRDGVGLRDWERRVRDRLDEERLIGDAMVRRIEEWFGYDFAGKRVLVVGTATGAEYFVLAARGATVCGIDVNAQAVSILHLKARARGGDAQGVMVAAAEGLPFAGESFDFVYCYTVLEHVADVERSIDEMIRVCRVGGRVFIQTPDYRFPFEGHYKLPLVPFAPRFVQAMYLRFRGRPTRFLRSINFLTVDGLNRILWTRNVITLRAWAPDLATWRAAGNWVLAWFAHTFAVQKHQYILLIKQRPVASRSGSQSAG